jgi:hypothetical protein
MIKYVLPAVFVITVVFYACSCNRKTAKTEAEDTSARGIHATGITPEISADDPFRNQPNDLCTIIRRLDILYYDPEKNVDDPSAYPEKYCLLDICLDDTSNYSGIVNIGDSIEPINTIFQLVKVFDSEDEARTYAAKYGIKDMQ